MTTLRVVAYRSGHLSFIEGAIDARLPEGSLLVASGPADVVRETVTGLARLAYDNETWLVPGVPEAEGDEAAYSAFVNWFERVQISLERRGVSLRTKAGRRRRSMRA